MQITLHMIVFVDCFGPVGTCKRWVGQLWDTYLRRGWFGRHNLCKWAVGWGEYIEPYVKTEVRSVEARKAIHIIMERGDPEDKWRDNNIIITSKRPCNVVLML